MALYAIDLWLPLFIVLPLMFLLVKNKIEVNRKSKQLPPGPHKLPIIGNLHQLGSFPHQALWQLSKKYGPVMFLQLGRVPTVIISSAKAAEEVLKVHDHDCCSRPLLAGTGKLSYNYLDMAFTPYGDYWREIRKICVLELFSAKRVRTFQPIREEEVALLIDSLSQSASSGSPVTLDEKFLTLSADITCRVAFGKSFRGSRFDGDRFQETIHEAMAMLGCRSASDFFPSVGWIIDRVTGLHGRLDRSFRELDAFYLQVIDDHLNPGRMKQEQDDIIDVLLRIETDQSEFGAVRLTKDHIKAILMALWQLSKKYGPVMFLQLGRVPTVIISSAKAAEEVLKVHDHDCCSRPLLAGTGKLSYNYLDMAFTPYGDYWREIRKICVLELFSAKRVRTFQPIREEEVALLIDSLSQSASSGSPVTLDEKFLTLSADITCRVAFGKSFRGSRFDGDRFQETIHEAMAMLGCRSASDFFPSVGWIIDRVTGLHGRLDRSFRELDAFYLQVIDDHLNPGRMKQEQDDIIDVLLRIETDQSEFGAVRLTKDHIKAILMDIFLAAVDTGTITMVWAMAELARNPRVMKKAQDEIRSCVGKKGKVSESDIDQLQFLNMVVKETLRLHPPAPLLIPRETMSHFKLNGYDIDPKTRMHINVWAIGRDPNIWRVPEELLPERFIDNPIDFKGQHFEFLPFGAGRRGCPGIHMGTAMVELALANLLYCFDWKLPNGMKEQDVDMEEAAGQTVHKKSGLSLMPTIHQWPSEDDTS